MANMRSRVHNLERTETFDVGAGAALGGAVIFEYEAKEPGFIEGIEFVAGNDIGSSYSAGTDGLRIVIAAFTSAGTAVSGDRGDFGLGSATNGDAADDKLANVKAYSKAAITNASNKTRFNKGDILRVTCTPDGSNTVGRLNVINRYDGIGRA